MAAKTENKSKRSKLTPRQQCFVQEYLIDTNATKAAIRAGYSVKNADKIGPELLGKARVREAVDIAMAARARRTGITPDRVLQEYAKIAFADIKDFLEYRTEKTVVEVDKETGEPIIDYRQIIDMNPSEEVDGTLIQEISISPKGVFTFKLHDKKGALDALAKHLGMFIEKHEVTGKDGSPVAMQISLVDELTPEERKKLILNASKRLQQGQSQDQQQAQAQEAGGRDVGPGN